MTDERPHAGADALANRVCALLADVFGEPCTNGDRMVLHELARVPAHLDRSVRDGVLSTDAAFTLLREASLLHQLLLRRSSTAERTELADELTRATEQLCVELGFDRAMAFAVSDGQLDVVTTHFVEHERWADHVDRCARRDPPRLDLAVLESAVVEGKKPALVADPQNDPGSWKPVVLPLRTMSYVSAPVVVGGRTVATLHADRWFTGAHVTTGDRDLLGLVAEEVPLRLAAGRGEQPAIDAVLTSRQIEVLELVAQGATNREIARRLLVTPETVKSHLSNIFERLGVSSRAGAVGRFHELCSPAGG